MGIGERNNPFLKWQRDQAIGPVDLVDRFGRVIGRGDLVMMPGDSSVIWQVMEVKVDLMARPGVPAGVTLLQIQLAATRVQMAKAGAPVPDLLKVADYTETQLYQQEQAQREKGQES